MAYLLYLDGMLLPVTPPAIKVSYKSSNETVRLIDGGQVTFLRQGELPVFSFELLLPRHKYSFCRYESGFKNPEYYVEKLLAIRGGRVPFRFICTRTAGNGSYLDDTNVRVSLEDMSIQEDADEGSDIVLSLQVREYREYSASRVKIEKAAAAASVLSARETDNSPTVTTYTVASGDCLWNIAKKYLGDGARWNEIYALNTGQISNPNLIYPGQVLTVP